MESLLSFLKREVEGEERIAMANPEVKDKENNNRQRSKYLGSSEIQPTAAALASVDINGNKCVFCGNNHSAVDCYNAQEMSIEKKRRILFEAGKCFGCTRTGHISSGCRARCVICKGNHIPLMCPKMDNNRGTSKKPNNEKDKNKEVDLLAVRHNLSVSSSSEVYLQSFLVIARNGRIERQARVLIDCGSQRSYIRKGLALELGYEAIDEEQIVHSLFGGSSSGIIHHNFYKIHLMSLDRRYACKLTALDQPTIASHIPLASLNKIQKDELYKRRVLLAKDSKGQIDILLGADVAGKLWTGKRILLNSGLVAMHSEFGWTLMGTVKNTEVSQPNKIKSSYANVVSMLYTSEADIADLGKLESIGIVEEKKTREERQLATLEHINDTVGFISGRYEVRLPWREDWVDSPSNRVGVKWNRHNDTLGINVDWWEMSTFETVTKRKILSVGQKIFDPVGFTVPATLYNIKLLVQKLWDKKIGWDEPYILGSLRSSGFCWK